MLYSFNYNVDDNDYLEFVKYHHSNSRDSRKRILFSQLSVPAVLAIWIAFQLLTHRDPIAIIAMGIVFVVFSVIWIFLLSKRLLWMSMKSGIKNMKKDGGVPYDRDIRLELDEEHIYQYTEEVDAKAKYSNIEKIAQGSDAIYVYTNALHAFIIPFRAFKSETQRNEFLEFLRRKQTI